MQNWSANGGTSTGTSIDGEGKTSTSTSRNEGHSVSEVARAVVKPEEVQQLDSGTAVVFAPCCPPIFTRLIPYYTREFRGAMKRYGALSRLLMAMRALAIAVLAVGPVVLIAHAVEKDFARKQRSQQKQPPTRALSPNALPGKP